MPGRRFWTPLRRWDPTEMPSSWWALEGSILFTRSNGVLVTARTRVVLRRRPEPFEGEPSGPYPAEGLGIDYALRRVTVDGEPVKLTATEYPVLYELAVHAPRVLTHTVLLQRVWGTERVGEAWLVRKRGEEAPPQAGGRRQRPQVYPHRAPRRVPYGGGGHRNGTQPRELLISTFFLCLHYSDSTTSDRGMASDGSQEEKTHT